MNAIEIAKKSFVRKSDVSSLDFSKLPPQCLEIEQAVLGAILMDKDCLNEVMPILKSPDNFYSDANQRIYRAILDLYSKNQNIDLLTVNEQLKKSGDLDAVGGSFALAQLSNSVGSTAHIESWAYLVKEAWVKRTVISIGTEAISQSFDNTCDFHDVLDKALFELGTLSADVIGAQTKDWKSVVDDFDVELHSNTPDGGLLGFSSGYDKLDERLLGFQKKQLNLIAGRPGEGKTTIAIQALRANAKKGIPVGFFSLEMPADEILIKLYAMEAGINTIDIQKKALTREQWERYRNAKQEVREWPIYIHDRSGITIQEIKSMATAWRVKHGVELIFIDYLQLVTVGNDVRRVNNREQEIGHIARAMKAMAMNLDVSVVSLSAMSREIEGRAKKEKRPNNSDLRESGSLEQDANKIVFVFRPEEHGIDVYDDGTSTAGMTEFIITKARLSAKGMVKARFEGQYSRFIAPLEDTIHHPQAGSGFKRIEKVEEDTPF